MTPQSLIFSAFSINLMVPSSSSNRLSFALLTIVTLSSSSLSSESSEASLKNLLAPVFPPSSSLDSSESFSASDSSDDDSDSDFYSASTSEPYSDSSSSELESLELSLPWKKRDILAVVQNCEMVLQRVLIQSFEFIDLVNAACGELSCWLGVVERDFTRR